MGHRVKSDFLTARTSFCSGAARLLDFYGLYDSYNVCRDERQADSMAILSDWMIVGQDLDDAITVVGQEVQNASSVRAVEDLQHAHI